MAKSTSVRFIKALETLMHAKFAEMTYPQLKRASRGLVMKPHELSHGELLEQLSQLREAAKTIYEGHQPQLELRLWDYDKKEPYLTNVLSQEEMDKQKRKQQRKRLQTIFSEESFGRMSRGTLNRRLGLCLKVERNQDVYVWFCLTGSEISLLQAEGTLEGREADELDTEGNSDFLTLPWSNMPELKKLVTQILDEKSFDTYGGTCGDEEAPSEAPVEEPVNKAPVEEPVNKAPVEAPVEEPVEEAPVAEGVDLAKECMERVERERAAMPKMDWAESVAYRAHKALEEGSNEIPGLCLNNDGKLQFNIEQCPYQYTIDSVNKRAIFECVYPDRDDVQLPVEFSTDNAQISALELAEDVERALDIETEYPLNFDNLPTAQEVDAKYGNVTPEPAKDNDFAPQPIVAEAPTLSLDAASVYEEYWATLQNMTSTPVDIIRQGQGGTIILKINGEHFTLIITQHDGVPGELMESESTSRTSGRHYKYSVGQGGLKARQVALEGNDVLMAMDTLVKAIVPSDALYDTYEAITIDHSLGDKAEAYFILLPDGTPAIHVILDSSTQKYTIIQEKDGIVKPSIAELR